MIKAAERDRSSHGAWRSLCGAWRRSRRNRRRLYVAQQTVPPTAKVEKADAAVVGVWGAGAAGAFQPEGGQTAGAAMSEKAMIVAGVMSGTSADGINVALVRIRRGSPLARQSLFRPPAVAGEGARATSFTLLGHAEYSYPAKVRAAVLSAMNAKQASVADLARLNFLLGELYADAVLATQRQFRVKADLVGCHGQTLYHQGEARIVSRPKDRCDLADGRGRGNCGAGGSAGRIGFSSGGYGGGRQGSAACSLSRLSALSRSEDRPHRAEHRRHRESHGDSCRGRRESRVRLRYRAREHGDRCGDRGAVWAGV